MHVNNKAHVFKIQNNLKIRHNNVPLKFSPPRFNPRRRLILDGEISIFYMENS
jgi:hypothetical protein